MEIGPINPINANAPVNTPATTQDGVAFIRQLVTAIRGLNKSELLGQGRELSFTRDPQTNRPVIQIVDSDSGDVVEQIPPETLLWLAGELGPAAAYKDA